MTTEETNQKSFSRATRVPLEAVVRLHFEGEVSYQNGFSANVSATGMFVKHPEPHAVGSRLVFECLVGQQRQPIQGIGQVVWARPRYEGPGLPAGMGIEFLEVDAQSREYLAQALFEYLEESLGGEVAAVDEEAGEPPAAAPSAVGEESEPFRLELEASASEAPEETWGEPRPETQEDLREEDRWAVSAAPRAWEPTPEPAPFPADEPPGEPFGRAWEPVAPQIAEESPSAEEPWRAVEPERWVPEPAAREPEWTAETAGGGGSGRARPDSRRGWLWGALAALLLLGLGAAAWLWVPSWNRAAPAPSSVAAEPPGEDAEAPGPAPQAPAVNALTAAGPAIPAAPAATPPAASPEPPPALRFGGVRDLRWERSGPGTEVAVLLDGSIAAGDWSFASMPGENPRLLLKLRGVSRPFRPNRVEVGTPEVRAVRFGLHAGARGDEQHLVLDLGSCDPRRATVSAEADRLLVLCPAL